jgi:predicted DNA-binding protein with PD1-like motif
VRLPIEGAHEVAGVGIIAPDKEGKPKLHIHASLGKGEKVLTGCLRYGAKTWLVGEAIIYEITGSKARRLPDPESGFELMEVG